MILANTFLNDIFIVFTKHHRSLQRYRNETSRQTNSQELQVLNKSKVVYY